MDRAVQQSVPADDAVSTITRWDIPKGYQVLVRLQDSDAMLCIVNPDDGRKPYFIYADKGFDEITELSRKGEE